MRYSLIAFPLFLIVLLIVKVPLLPAKTVLKMNHQFPKDAVGSLLDQWFAEQVFEKTRGDLEIKIYWSNALGEPKENLVLLKNQAIDMAALSAGYFPNELPLHSAPNSIPMGIDNICQSSRMMRAFLTEIPAFREEAARNGVRSLFFHLLNPYLLVVKKPVRQLDDLKGLRIRSWGKDMPKLIEGAGAKPVTMFLPDIYDALKHGVLDGCPFSPDLMVSYKIYELARHVTEVIMWEGPSWGVWISEKTWHKLNRNQQQVLMSVAELARQREVAKTLEADRKARQYLKGKGVVFHPFPETDLVRWKEASPDFFKTLQQRLDQAGSGEAGRQMIRLWKRMRLDLACP